MMFKFPSVILLIAELSATLRNKVKILPKISLFALGKKTVTFDTAVTAWALSLEAKYTIIIVIQ